jgi:hypothetical protein
VAEALRFSNNSAETAVHARLRQMIKATETLKRHLWCNVIVVQQPSTNSATEAGDSMIQSARHTVRDRHTSLRIEPKCCFIYTNFGSAPADAPR